MQTTFNRISVVGLGYIGLPTAAIIASRNVEVIGVDVSENVVNIINQGKIHIVEPDLDILVRATVQTGKLRAVVRPEPADAFLIAVPTPLTDEKSPELSYVFAAAKSISPVLEKGNLVILESTCPVGTTEQMVEQLADARPDLSFPNTAGEKADIQVAYCPERVLPGKVLRELVDNDRIMGGVTPGDADRAADVFCGMSKVRPRYSAMTYLVKDERGQRDAIDLGRISRLEREEWALTAPIGEVYAEVEMATERQPDATLMGVAAILLRQESEVLERNSPWGQGLGGRWNWEKVKKQYPGIESRAVDYFAVLHLTMEVATRDGGFCGV